MESPKRGSTDLGALDESADDLAKSKLGDKIEKLHSQFVLEIVGLRKEVAGLKKKKWVLRSVLASGGESERLAIENEVMELRKSGGGAFFKKASGKKEAVEAAAAVNMVIT